MLKIVKLISKKSKIIFYFISFDISDKDIKIISKENFINHKKLILTMEQSTIDSLTTKKLTLDCFDSPKVDKDCFEKISKEFSDQKSKFFQFEQNMIKKEKNKILVNAARRVSQGASKTPENIEGSINQ